MTEEKWAKVPEHPGYLVSDQGRVWSIRAERYLAGAYGKRYRHVVLPGRKTRTVQRLVMEAFVGKRPPGMVIRHLNHNGFDNRLVNLNYGTQKQNVADAQEARRLGIKPFHTPPPREVPMARTAKLTKSHTVQMSEEWSERLSAVADHPKIQDSIASVIRDCIQASLPGFELELGLIELEEAAEGAGKQLHPGHNGQLDPIDMARLAGFEIAPTAPVKEDRSAGCFGGPPLPATRVG